MKNPKLIICGNYGATNLGDEAILDGILTLIRRVEPSADITVLSADPEKTNELHGVRSIGLLPAGPRSFAKGAINGSIFKTFKEIGNCDGVILGGGGLFTDEKPLAILIWSIQARLAQMLNKPVFCLGQSVGPLNTTFGRRMTSKVFRNANTISVRDSGSRQLLDDLGVNMVKVLADPAFAIECQSSPSKDYVVFSIRPWIRGNNKLYKICAQFIDYIWDKFNLRAILVPFKDSSGGDLVVLHKIFDQVKDRSSVEILDYESDFKRVIQLISGAKAVVGMRLHSIIFSTLVGRPFLALSYSDKVKQFVNEVDLRENCLNWEDLTLEDLKEKFDNLMANIDRYENRIVAQRNDMREKVFKHDVLMKEFLSSI